MRRRAYLTRLFTLVANIATVLRLLITVYAVDIGAHPTLFFCETVHIRTYFTVLYSYFILFYFIFHFIIFIFGVARICCEEGQRWKLCHGAITMDFMAGCSSCSMSLVTNAVLIERAVSCWHLHQLISQTTQHVDSWLSADLLRS